MPDESAKPESSADLPQIHAETFSVIYSNWVQAGRTSWDIALAFGQVGETSPGVSVVAHMVNVVMTPPLAKALISTLALTVKAYERDNGEIVLPESVKRKASPSASRSPSSSASPSPESPEDET